MNLRSDMKLSLPKHTKTVVKVISDGSSRNRATNTENGARSIEKEKEEFLKHGKFPKSSLKKTSTQGEKSRKRRHVGVSFEFLPEAKRILDMVNENFINGDGYLEEVFGDTIEQSEASKYLIDYLQMQGLAGALRILWTKEINCCGRIIWTGPDARLNKPEKRRYSLWLKSTSENVFLRQQAIKGLADHEIGTHYVSLCVMCVWLNESEERYWTGKQEDVLVLLTKMDNF